MYHHNGIEVTYLKVAWLKRYILNFARSVKVVFIRSVSTSVVCASQQSRCQLVNDLRLLFTEQLVSEHELNVSQYSPSYTTPREGKKPALDLEGISRNILSSDERVMEPPVLGTRRVAGHVCP